MFRSKFLVILALLTIAVTFGCQQAEHGDHDHATGDDAAATSDSSPAADGAEGGPMMARTETGMRGLVISRSSFNKGLAESSSFRTYVLRTLTGRLSHMVDLISGFAFDRLDLRVAVWLAEQFERSSGRAIEVTHNDVADELGTTREMISRILKDFEHKRCIELARGKIHLICKNTLHMVSKGKGKVRKDLAG